MPPLERERLDLLAKVDATKSQSERNRMGQFGTPSSLAAEITASVLATLENNPHIRFLEPGFGTGAFYSALLHSVPAERITTAEGFEIDPHYGRQAARLWRDTPLRLHERDFLTAHPPAEDERFNVLIANPPYIRHHHIDGARKAELQRIVADRTSIDLSGLAGLYCYFMGAAHPWMTAGGIAAWLVPSEFMDVNYGKALKSYLLRSVTLLRIHRFDPFDTQFDDALVSSAIVIFKNELPPLDHCVEFTFGGTLTAPRARKQVPATQLLAEKKWTRFPTNGARRTSRFVLSDFFKIKRGIATGANEFFVLPADEIDRRRLPRQFFRPILPGPRLLRTDTIQASADGTPVLDSNLFVLDCPLPEEDVRAKYPTLARYLDEGAQNGYRDRYLCSRRSPWYSQESRQPPPFLCTYIGRTNTKSGRPFRFIQNDSSAIASNVYLMLYAKPDLQAFLDDNPAAKAAVWRVLNEIPLKSLVLEGRVYGGGLHKLEPKELADVNADALADLIYGKGEAVPRGTARQAELVF